MRAFLQICVVLAALIVPSLAWGNTGHQIIASIASSILQTKCANCVNEAENILGGDTLESVATWADQVRTQSGWHWTAPLHYVNTPDWACNYNNDQDCNNDMCVVGAINNFTSQITGGGDWGVYSLKFVIHFVGDAHQPLHVSFASDRGGNSIKGTFEGKKDNLHQVWDNAIIAKRISDDFSGDQNQYATSLLGEITGTWASQAKKWASCPSGQLACPDVWADETAALACTNAYKDSQGNIIANGYNLGDDYYNFNSGVVDQQLAKAAVRLAATLQRVFKSASENDLRSNDIAMN